MCVQRINRLLAAALLAGWITVSAGAQSITREIAAWGPGGADIGKTVNEPAIAVGGGKAMVVFHATRTVGGQRIGYAVRSLSGGAWSEGVIPLSGADVNGVRAHVRRAE